MEPGVDYIGVSIPFYCNDGKGNFLMHKRSKTCRDEQEKWDFGGGQLEFGELPAEAALREIKEEWGVDGEIQEQLPAHSIIRERDGKRTHWLAIPFFVKVDITKAKVMEPDKATEMGIFRFDSLPQPLHTGAQKTMTQYRKHFEKYM